MWQHMWWQRCITSGDVLVAAGDGGVVEVVAQLRRWCDGGVGGSARSFEPGAVTWQ
jgi:hypothetical protein